MIISPLTSFYNTLEEIIQQETTSMNGVLGDVETVLTDSYNDEYIELPLIWIEKQPITPGTVGHFSSSNMYHRIPVTIICCSEEHSTYHDSEIESLSIASRVITTIQRNIGPYIKRATGNWSIQNITLNTIDPTGTFEIPSKRVIIPGTRVEITFEVSIDYMNYEEIKDGQTHMINFDNSTYVEQIDIDEIIRR